MFKGGSALRVLISDLRIVLPPRTPFYFLRLVQKEKSILRKLPSKGVKVLEIAVGAVLPQPGSP